MPSLQADDPRDRLLAVKEWVESGDPSVVPELIAQFDVEDHDTVICALLIALGKLGGKPEVPIIAKYLAAGERKLRERALAALITLQVPSIYPHLVQRLADESDGALRNQARDQVLTLGADKIRSLLGRLCDSQDETRQRTAITSVIYLDFPGRKDFLADLMKSESPRIRAWADGALQALGGPDPLPSPEESRYSTGPAESRPIWERPGDDREARGKRKSPPALLDPLEEPDPEASRDPRSHGQDDKNQTLGIPSDEATRPHAEVPTRPRASVRAPLDDGWEDTIVPGPPKRAPAYSGGMGMGDSRACPSCSELIPRAARACRFCRARFAADGSLKRGPDIDDPLNLSVPPELVILALLNGAPMIYGILKLLPQTGAVGGGKIAEILIAFATIQLIAIGLTLARRNAGRLLWILTILVLLLIAAFIIRIKATVLLLAWVILTRKPTRFYCSE